MTATRARAAAAESLTPGPDRRCTVGGLASIAAAASVFATMDHYDPSSYTAAEATAVDRATFIRRTYLHTGGAILAFAALESFLLSQAWARSLAISMVGSWWLVMIAFIAVSWVADWWARSEASPALQYVGLGAFVVAEAVIFLPLLMVAQARSDAYLIPSAGIMTLLLLAGITATAFITKKDFSFLRGALVVGWFVAIGVMICGWIFGFQLGLWFSAAMILFAGGSLLYTTSNLIHQYRTNQHVAASLALFSGIMLMFWYILRLLMSRR